MRYLYLLTFTILLTASCNKKEENKCLNGGVQEADICICPWGYEGSICETAISEYLTGTYQGQYNYKNIFSRDAQLVIQKHPNSDKAPTGIRTFLRDDTEDFYFNDATVISKTDFSFTHDTDTLTLNLYGKIIDNDSINMVVIQTTPTGNNHTVTFSGRKI